MASQPVSKTVLGGFVIGAVALLVAAVLILGGGSWFEWTIRYVLFFDRSVGGLRVGAPVVLRGVQVGSVKRIEILADADRQSVDIPVVIEVFPGRLRMIGSPMPEDPFERARRMIACGIRAQLTSESLVTGQLLVELDFHPEVPPRLRGLDVGLPELPTMASGFDLLADRLAKIPIDQVFDRLQNVLEGAERLLNAPELAETVRHLKTTAEGASRLVADLDRLAGSAEKTLARIDREIEPVSAGLQAGLGDARQLIQDVNREVRPLATRAGETLASARETLDRAARALRQAEGLLDERSSLRHELGAALVELAAAARSVKALADYLEQHPEALIRGKGANGGN